tara:strand:- start:99 stop:935 length:837 start_codon:yes stop_codon:yes gene_type:complete
LLTIDNIWPKDWGRKTSIMGILNITPDSFSDGGDFFNIKNALIQTKKLVLSGIDILDIGAQSTRPGADNISSKEEIKRLLPALIEIRKNFPELIISIDTFRSEVAYEALNNGANWINDVSGGRMDKSILDVVAEFDCPYVITHSKGDSKTMDKLSFYDDLMEEIIYSLKELTETAINKKVSKDKIIWDPGLGFAKNSDHNIFILKNLDKLKKYNFPILIGASRKRFIGEILNEDNPKNRDIGTLAISCLCSQKNIEIVRVHDASTNYQVLKVADKIYR